MNYDIIIVGGGPAGLSSAIYALRARKKVLVIEKENFGGAIVTASKVANYPGYEMISGMELGEKFYDQAKKLGMVSEYGEVTSITKKDNLFHVVMDGKEYTSKSVIYAAGASAGKLKVKDEERLVGSGVSYCATCDGSFFKDKDVAVIGGGGSALDDASYLANIAHQVYVIYRKEVLNADAMKIEGIQSKENVLLMPNTIVKDIIGENQVEGLVLESREQPKEIKVSGVFVAIGRVPNTDILEGFIDLDSKDYILTNESMETNVPGFYAVGDVREKNVRQVVTATNDGAIAGLGASQYVSRLK